MKKIGRNDICPCGCGEKHKKHQMKEMRIIQDTERFFELKQKYKTIKIITKGDDLTKLKLETNMKMKILQSIDQWKSGSGTNIDSYGFISPHIDGLEKSQISGPSELTVGDIVYLYNPDNSYSHYAIHIGNNNYLSKWGLSGPFVISKEAEMHEYFKTSHFQILTGAI